MWDCYNCAFQNVDTSPICSRCRARKPEHGEKIKRRSYEAQEEASQERAAGSVMDNLIPSPPSMPAIMEKWEECADSKVELLSQLAVVEHRQYALREAFRSLISVVKNPQNKGRMDVLQSTVQTLIDWDG